MVTEPSTICAARQARQLAISPGTVKNHRKSIYSKLGISSQTELFSLFLDCLRAIMLGDSLA